MYISRINLSSVVFEPKHRKSKIKIYQKKYSNPNKSKGKAKSDSGKTTKCNIFEVFPYFRCFRIFTNAANVCNTLINFMSFMSDNWTDEYLQGNDPPLETLTQWFQNTKLPMLN